MARLRPPFVPPEIPPEKVYVGPFICSFPGNEAHKLFSGGPKWGDLGGGLKVYAEKVCAFFVPYLFWGVVLPHLLGEIFRTILSGF